ncbi:MAG TPA: serine/threonine-protein kinase, partial [Polyangiaceae bacterium]|nr:serine/threonine-protein kinase [Polyangiaceae bacterium]
SESRPSHRPKPKSVRPAKPGLMPPIFAVGDVLSDAYEIRRALGSGANGQVFEAHDRLLNRRVAIKAAWPTLSRLGPMLRKEGQALAALRHPAIVSIYAMGVHEGTEYFVMENVLGVTLDEHLKRRGEKMPLLEALDVLVSLAEGLAAVHRAGIAHRDVKPSNVMLAPGNRVVLMDLGLVLPEFEPTSPVAKGTPNYMAPESILGVIEPGDAHLVDTYALGVLAFLLTCGKLPFEAKTTLAVAQKHVEDPVPALGDGAPPKLAALVGEMLAKDPLARPQQLESVSFRLRAIRSALNVPQEPDAKFRVLVVDDDKDIAKLVKMTVRASLPSADVVVASSAKQALDVVRASPPHLLFLDIQMPDMNGVELYMVLRAERLAERTTIVAASAAAKPADVELLYSLGVARFLEKGAAFRAGVAAVAKEIFEAHWVA